MSEESLEIRNRVKESGIMQVHLDDLYVQGERVVLDFSQFLFQSLLVKEKDFREKVEAHDWSQYSGKVVRIEIPEDALIPSWSNMLVASKLLEVGAHAFSCSADDLEERLFERAVAAMDVSEYHDKIVMVRGCGHHPVPESAYLMITQKLQPVVKKLMFGEACSSVPVFRRK